MGCFRMARGFLRDFLPQLQREYHRQRGSGQLNIRTPIASPVEQVKGQEPSWRIIRHCRSTAKSSHS
jgi:hypothetical protein